MLRRLINIVEQVERNHFVKWIGLGILGAGVVLLALSGHLLGLLVPVFVFGLAFGGVALGKCIASCSEKLFRFQSTKSAVKLEVALSIFFFVLLPGIGMHVLHSYFEAVDPYASPLEIFGVAILAAMVGYVFSKDTDE